MSYSLAASRCWGGTAKAVYEQSGRLATVETDTQTSKTERFPRIDKDLQDIKDELKKMNGLLADRKLEQAAKNPKSPQVADEVKAAVSSAEASGTQIDLALVKEAGGKFIDAASVNSSAWIAANYCVSYRTTIDIGMLSFPTPTGPGKHEQTDDINFKLSEEQERELQKQPAGTDKLVLQLLNAGPIVPSSKAYILEFMSKPRRDYDETRPQFQIINAHGAYIYLDGMRMRQIVIENATVVYDGGPTELRSVYFVNCKFQINQKPTGVQFARQVLNTATATLSASG